MIKKTLFFLTISFLVNSCDDQRIFDDYSSIENNVWLKDQLITFDIPITDTIAKNNVFINIRNNENYEFSNLFLIAKMQFPNGIQIIDTLEYEMTDKLGNYLGSGFTDLKHNKLFYKENVRFELSGNYTFKVEHAMRKNGNIQGLDSLRGITDVGIRIETIQ